MAVVRYPGRPDHPTHATARSFMAGKLTSLRARAFIPADTALAAFASAPAIDAERFRADVDAAVDRHVTPRG